MRHEHGTRGHVSVQDPGQGGGDTCHMSCVMCHLDSVVTVTPHVLILLLLLPVHLPHVVAHGGVIQAAHLWRVEAAVSRGSLVITKRHRVLLCVLLRH